MGLVYTLYEDGRMFESELVQEGEVTTLCIVREVNLPTSLPAKVEEA